MHQQDSRLYQVHPKMPHQAISISDEKEIPLAIDWENDADIDESHECVDACLQEALIPGFQKI